MASLPCIFLVLCLSNALLMSSSSPVFAAADDDKKEYIVYMGALPSETHYSPMSHHLSLLQRVVGLNFVRDSLVRSYGRSFNGFAAKLTKAESKKLAGMEGIVSVFPSRVYQLHTTRSWDFMGVDDEIKRAPEVETNTIIGVIDSGIWPESPSFSDEGLGSPPSKWKDLSVFGYSISWVPGLLVQVDINIKLSLILLSIRTTGTRVSRDRGRGRIPLETKIDLLIFSANCSKVIGARHYVLDSTRDFEGHGTHTASIAAGNKVEDTSFYGLAQGTARGAIPSGRIAVYKVCEPAGCNAAAILKAFDDAIADGVDIITISIGGGVAPFHEDPLAIGAFHAMEKGIVTVAAAGNSGPNLGTVANFSPWILTVAAGNTDRKFVTKVVTGDGMTLLGKSIDSFDLNRQIYPFAYGKTASSICTEEQARACVSDCLDMVKDKILVCDGYGGVEKPKNLGAIGIIIHLVTDSIDIGTLPISLLDDNDYNTLISYITSTENPEGTIMKSEVTNDAKAPLVASFSSRGPNPVVDDILKPDITAPGVNILAAYPAVAPLSGDKDDTRRVDYRFLSGTSMACPHVAGAAAYIKTLHPDWSPSFIRSAIMTTARPMIASDNQGAEFAYGSGYINPVGAANPGLVYEATKEDYLTMLCAMNFTSESIKIISGEDMNCTQGSNPMVRDLNYPSLTARVFPSPSSEITFSRTLTNVGTAKSEYKAQVTWDPSLSVKVEPETLSFKALGEKQSFKVTVSGNSLSSISGLASASLVWSDGSHVVRSPIVVYS
ncbi:PREDICTED: subtilisin-like protease SBT4.2 [Tarenaya hassleriana]|uniref:subtilisin-like protease SBT4.2 n=1 Tax=Tarenaya hassleriana TaxID=28532 RepID=UPI0008FCE510|nr:PREDICTED: subtilisin-like protease SBT4.2 [Tarenaya hassleriana]